MEAELLALANAAGATMVALAATDAWAQARRAVTSLWQRVHPDQVETIDAEFADVRRQVVAAREADNPTMEQALVAEWQGRLVRLLATEPALAINVRQLLDDELGPALAAATGQTPLGAVTMTATASDNGRIYQVGQGTQNINER